MQGVDAAAEAAELAHLAAHRIPDVVALIDEEGMVRWVNASGDRLDPGGNWVGTRFYDRLHPADAESARGALEALHVGHDDRTDIENEASLEFRLRDGDGQFRTFETRGNAFEHEDERLVAVTLREVTATRRWSLDNGGLEALETLLDYSATLTLRIDPDGIIRSVSGSLLRQLGWRVEATVGRPVYDMIAVEDRARVRKVLTGEAIAPVAPADGSDGAGPNGAGAPARGSGVRGNARARMITFDFVHRNGRRRTYEMAAVDLRDDAVVRGILLSGHDVSELTAIRERFAYLATHDVLTKLPNRVMFTERMAEVKARSRRSGRPFVVFFADLDGFKVINDTFGHAEGDRVLAQAADRLGEALRELDFLARLSGDEFVAIAEDIDSVVADQITERIEESVATITRPVRIGVSVGYTFATAEDSDLEILARADAEMYEHKQARKNAS